jgi:uncharacterized protein (DUF58 family)
MASSEIGVVPDCGGEAEEVVVDRAVDRDAVVAVVAAGHADRFRILVVGSDGEERVGPREVVEVAVDRRQGL